MASVPELLSVYENSDALAAAEDALDQIAAMGPMEDLPLGDYYDGLAEVAGEEGDFPLAVRAQRRAVEHGCEHLELAQEMLAWYLLKAERRDEGEAAFAELRGGARRRPANRLHPGERADGLRRRPGRSRGL